MYQSPTTGAGVGTDPLAIQCQWNNDQDLVILEVTEDLAVSFMGPLILKTIPATCFRRGPDA